ncbi:MAG: hypothetical protein KDB22_06470 [Planctomycetales bacterium]|nr:hypothetical protein [Planctomycetales bacterium]
MSNIRGKVYVDRAVQGTLARRICAHWCLFFVMCLASLFAMNYFLGEPHLTLSERLGQLWTQYAFFVVLMVATIPAFVYDSVKLSHRFVGPVLRLKQGLRKLAAGEAVPEMRFREGDFWKELSDDFNQLAARMGALPQLQDGDEHCTPCECPNPAPAPIATLPTPSTSNADTVS